MNGFLYAWFQYINAKKGGKKTLSVLQSLSILLESTTLERPLQIFLKVFSFSYPHEIFITNSLSFPIKS